MLAKDPDEAAAWVHVCQPVEQAQRVRALLGLRNAQSRHHEARRRKLQWPASSRAGCSPPGGLTAGMAGSGSACGAVGRERGAEAEARARRGAEEGRARPAAVVDSNISCALPPLPSPPPPCHPCTLWHWQLPVAPTPAVVARPADPKVTPPPPLPPPPQ
jgi:hypothetical protein